MPKNESHFWLEPSHVPKLLGPYRSVGPSEVRSRQQMTYRYSYVTPQTSSFTPWSVCPPSVETAPTNALPQKKIPAPITQHTGPK